MRNSLTELAAWSMAVVVLRKRTRTYLPQLEFIEIALRTKLIYHLSQAYNGLWYLDDNIVTDKTIHQDCVTDLQTEFTRSGENFAKEFCRKYPNDNPDAWQMFVVISTMVYLCNAINPNNEIKNKLLALFNNNPDIPIYKMGFFNNWQNEPLWK